MPQLTCRDLSLGYDGRVIAENINFTVRGGDYLCIVGENGTGKSTLIKTLLSLKAPMSGNILAGDGLRRHDIGYLPQQTSMQRDFPASVREIVLSGCLNRCGLRPYYNRAEKALAAEKMRLLGISDLAFRCYRELSGGQQQRVLLARALCAARKMILLDEPVAGLDPIAAQEMYDLIRKINCADGITVLMVSHDISAALRYASHILHVKEKASFFGTRAEYLRSPAGRRFCAPGGEGK